MTDNLEAFVSGFTTGAFRVIGSPAKIFLCGGPFGKPGDPPASLRQIFFEHLQGRHSKVLPQILLAEKARDWYEAARVYPNLLELEEHIAGLSAIILLFVESAGSIAELGAFSEGEPFRKKLIAIVEDRHYNQRSFIKQGPLKLIETYSESSVRAFPWLKKSRSHSALHQQLCREAVREIERRLPSDLREHAEEQTFRANEAGHRMLLLADLVGLTGAIRQADLQRIFDVWKIGMTTADLEKYMFLLENLEIIKRIKYGHSMYAIPTDPKTSYIAYPTRVSGRIYDRLRLRNQLQQSLPDDRERRRVYKRAENGGI